MAGTYTARCGRTDAHGAHMFDANGRPRPCIGNVGERIIGRPAPDPAPIPEWRRRATAHPAPRTAAWVAYPGSDGAR